MVPSDDDKISAREWLCPYCLYNIVEDPGEHNELSSKEPDMLHKLLNQYNEYSKEPREMQDQGIHSEGDLPEDRTVEVATHLFFVQGYGAVAGVSRV